MLDEDDEALSMPYARSQILPIFISILISFTKEKKSQCSKCRHIQLIALINSLSYEILSDQRIALLKAFQCLSISLRNKS